MDNIIAIPQQDAGTTGAIVYWSLSGDMIRDEFAEALEGAEISITVPECTKPTALRRAVHKAVSTKAGRGYLARKHPKGGYAIVSEDVDEDTDPTYEVLIHAHLGSDSRLVVEGDTSAVEEFGTSLQLYFEFFQSNLTHHEVSRMLTRQVLAKCQALSLRESGGFYFIPPSYVASWSALTKCVAGVSDHVFHHIPAMTTGDGAAAIIASLVRNTRVAVAKASKALDTEDKATRERALKSLSRHVDKLTHYGEVLGQELPDLHATCAEMRVTLTEALLTGGACV